MSSGIKKRKRLLCQARKKNLTVPLTFHQQKKTSHWSTPWIYIIELKRPTRKLCDSECIPFGRSLFTSLVINVNKTMIKNFFLNLKIMAKSAAKTILSQQRSFDSLAKIVLDNRIVLDELLGEQGGVFSLATTTCCVLINTSMETKSYKRSLSKVLGFFKCVTPSVGTLFDWFGSWGQWLWSALQIWELFCLWSS